MLLISFQLKICDICDAIYLYNQAEASGWRRSVTCKCVNKACLESAVPCFCPECVTWRKKMGFA